MMSIISPKYLFINSFLNITYLKSKSFIIQQYILVRYIDAGNWKLSLIASLNATKESFL